MYNNNINEIRNKWHIPVPNLICNPVSKKKSRSGKKVHKLKEYKPRELLLLPTIDVIDINKLFTESTGNAERALFFLSLLIQRHLVFKDIVDPKTGTADPHPYIYFNREELIVIWTRNFKKLIQKLIDAGYIDFIDRPSQDPYFYYVHTYWFRISAEFLPKSTPFYKRDKFVTRKGLQVANSYYNERSKVKIFARKQLNEVKELKPIVESMREKMLNTIIPTNSKEYNELIREKPALQDEIIKYNDRDGGHHSYIVDRFGHRFHTFETRMSSEIRLLMRDSLDLNARIGLIDIKNSQACVAAWILINPELVTNLLSGVKEDMVKLILTDYRNKEDFKQFVDHTTSGKIYNLFADRLDVEIPGWMEREEWYKKKTEDRRKKAKMLFFYTLFGPKTTFNREFKSVLYNMYPTAFNAINMIKSFKWGHINPSRGITKKGKVFEKNYSNVAMLMQRVESYIIINKVGGRFVKEFSWLSPIHDSYLLKQRDMEMGRIIILEEIEKLGLPAPQFNIEGQIEKKFNYDDFQFDDEE